MSDKNRNWKLIRSGKSKIALGALLISTIAWAQEPVAQQSAGTPSAVGPEEVVLTIGDQKITAAEFERIASALPPDAANALQGMGKRAFGQQYANMVALAKEAERQKLDQNDYFKNMIAFQRQMLLAQLAVNGLMQTMQSVSPEEINYYYTEHIQSFQQVNLRGIYVAFAPPEELKKPAAKGAKPKLSEDQAKAKVESIRLRLRSGEQMAAIARKESDDPTASKGGDFGWVRRNQFTTQIDNVIFNLEDKQVSIPIRDRFGYYIFQSQGKRTQPLEEAKAIIENGLRQQKMGETIQKAQEGYSIKLDPRYFGPEPGAPTSPQGK